jgi:phage shock protein A
MSWLGRVWGYIKAAVVGGVEQRMDPGVQIEQALGDARRQDMELRNQAARVIAHRTELQMRLDRAVEDSAKSRESAAQALRNADGAMKKGDSAEVDRWTRAAQAIALKLEAAESLVTSLKQQYGTATEQAELAKTQVNDNAMRLQELSAKRMELVGKLEQAKMQEEVNKTLQTLNRPVDTAGPTMREIEDKINRRMALASGQAELESDSIEGAQRDVEHSLAQVQAQARLDKLREELGLPAAAGDAAAAIGPSADTAAPTAEQTAGESSSTI